MSGYNNRRGSRGKIDSRINQTNAGSQSVWKPKAKTDESLDSASCSQNNKSSNTLTTEESAVKDVVSDLKLIPTALDDNDDDSKKVKQFGDKSQKDDDNNGRLKHPVLDIHPESVSPVIKLQCSQNSLDSSSCSQSNKASKMLVTGESVVKDVASGGKNPILVPTPLDDDDDSKKVKQFGDRSQKDDADNGRLKHPVLDICPKSVSHVIKLKTPLHVLNKERRNQSKQSMKGPNVIILRPGMVLMKGYISCDDQISIVKTCRELGISEGGFYQPGYSSGTKLHLKMFCLGRNWDPESRMYTELRPFDKSKPPGIPEKFHGMVKKAIQDSNEFIQGKVGDSDVGKLIPSMSPDVCIVNFYNKSGRLGLHQDKDESETSLKKGLPVVSFSVGDAAEFLYGETRAIDEADKVILESGDVLIFGGKSRLIYHGVTSILPDTAPRSLIEATNMCPGRLNLTFRRF